MKTIEIRIRINKYKVKNETIKKVFKVSLTDKKKPKQINNYKRRENVAKILVVLSIIIFVNYFLHNGNEDGMEGIEKRDNAE